MLLFIAKTYFFLNDHKRFNTSHVVIYRCGSILGRRQRQSFNTSHVVIYQLINFKGGWMAKVSIHPMLLFINFISCVNMSHTGFNTSHVVIYPTSLKHFHFCLSSFTLVLYTIFRFFTSLFEIFLILSQKCFKPLFHLYFKPFSKFYGW